MSTLCSLGPLFKVGRPPGLASTSLNAFPERFPGRCRTGFVARRTAEDLEPFRPRGHAVRAVGLERAVPPAGAPRIHGELLKLGFSISQAAVSKYMVRYPSPPSQSWRTFLTNHADCLASIDFFVVPTATFHLLFGFIVLHHERRQIVHLKLGFSISQAAVSKYMVRYPSPPSQSWRTFLTNHADCLASIDFFVVPTATFHLLFGFIVLHHERRQIVHFGVTANPTMAWVAQQIQEAFPWGTAPRYLIRDRDGAYGQSFRSTVTAMGVEEVVTAPRSAWQNPYVERLIGSVRRECLDHSIILNERHLRRILGSYLDYYHGSRTHLSLGKDTPDGRPVQPAGSGTVVSLPKVGGLHHRYERLAA